MNHLCFEECFDCFDGETFKDAKNMVELCFFRLFLCSILVGGT